MIETGHELARRFAARAAEHDRTGTFPHANYADVRAAGLPAFVVPERFGGWGATLLDTLMMLEALAQGDGSTALNVTMHFQVLGSAVESRTWPPALLEEVCRAAVERGALINSIATEPELGSPSRGGKPKTTATPVTEGQEVTGWLLRGRKSFASMSPALDYMIIPAHVLDGSDAVARFLVPLNEATRPRLEIVETWDALGMRSTGSHDIILHDLCVPAGSILERESESSGKEGKGGRGGTVNAWFMLGVSAVYLGVAQAALSAAAGYARTRVPTALGRPIAELESIRRYLGRAEFLLRQARAVLHAAARAWDECAEERPALEATVAVAKVTTTNNAVEAVQACMRVAGGAAMGKTLPLERYFRDVQAGLYHPIHDEAAYQMLARLALDAAQEAGAQERS